MVPKTTTSPPYLDTDDNDDVIDGSGTFEMLGLSPQQRWRPIRIAVVPGTVTDPRGQTHRVGHNVPPPGDATFAPTAGLRQIH